jgi:hypothetical protein
MRIHRFACVVASAVALAVMAFTAPARAELAIAIDKSRQQMTVALNGAELFVWPVSTGAPGYDTPSGTFTPFRMEKDHFSREWDDAPMPHSIFFTKKGHAIHGSNHVKAIGTPASHGCVRLEPKNARILFDLVKQEGMANVRVVLTGETPGADAPPQVARREPPAAGFERGFSVDSLLGDDAAVAAAPPPSRRSHIVRDYRNGRTYYYREWTYYHRPRYGNVPPPYYFGPYR